MKLVIVRHADPDYSIDSLTPTGWKEAELLSERLVKTPADAYYVSPLGRAKDTASLTLKKLGRTAETKEWLREFSPRIVKPGMDRSTSIWDWLPEIWTKELRYYDPEEWYHTDAMRSVNAEQEYKWVTKEFDRLLGCPTKPRYHRAVLPLRRGMCAVKPPAARFPDAAVARPVRGTILRHHHLYRRTAAGHRKL